MWTTHRNMQLAQARPRAIGADGLDTRVTEASLVTRIDRAAGIVCRSLSTSFACLADFPAAGFHSAHFFLELQGGAPRNVAEQAMSTPRRRKKTGAVCSTNAVARHLDSGPGSASSPRCASSVCAICTEGPSL